MRLVRVVQQSIRRACALLNAAAKRRAKAPASEGAAEKADQPLDSIDTAVVFSKRVSKYYTCKSVLCRGVLSSGALVVCCVVLCYVVLRYVAM